MIRLVFSNLKIKNRTQRDFFEERNKNKIEKFRSFLETKNILYPKNGLIFLSSQTTKKDINYIIKNFKIALEKFL
jgi:glutamate-1-semialdehyde aminotransferase